jgi:2-dehydro-3-deoxygluconokinase
VSSLLAIKPADECRFDLVALGEVMLRLDPGEARIATTREFRAWEGGGEYNVARGLRRCFGLRTAVVTALADNPVGRLIEDLILTGGVDVSHVRWLPYDGIGRSLRNGLNFTERGFGVRAAVGCSDRGHTAASQLRPGDVDWAALFAAEPTRWLHCGGIFAGLSETTAAVAEEAMRAAREAGTTVSYDLNFRPSLWQGIGGSERAIEVNRTLAGLVDVSFGNEEDFSAALGYEVAGTDASFSLLDPESYATMLHEVVADYPRPARDRDEPAGRPLGLEQRLGRHLPRRRSRRSDKAARTARDPRPRGRGRLLCLRPDLRPSHRATDRGGAGDRRRARRACHDDARRHVNGDTRRGEATRSRRIRPCRPLADPAHTRCERLSPLHRGRGGRRRLRRTPRRRGRSARGREWRDRRARRPRGGLRPGAPRQSRRASASR